MDMKLLFVLSALLLAGILVSTSNSPWLHRSLQGKFAPWLPSEAEQVSNAERLNAAIIRIPESPPRVIRQRFTAQEKRAFQGRWTTPDSGPTWVGEILETSPNHYIFTRKAMRGVLGRGSSCVEPTRPIVLVEKDGKHEGYRVVALLKGDLLSHFGLEIGDVLTHVNRVSLGNHPMTIYRLLTQVPKDTWVKVTLRRGEVVKQMHYKLGEP